MQNEPKFRKVKFNVTKVLTMDYDRMDTWSRETKQSQTNPNKAKQSQFLPAISVAGQSQYMLPRLTINTRPNQFRRSSYICGSRGFFSIRIKGERVRLQRKIQKGQNERN